MQLYTLTPVNTIYSGGQFTIALLKYTNPTVQINVPDKTDYICVPQKSEGKGMRQPHSSHSADTELVFAFKLSLTCQQILDKERARDLRFFILWITVGHVTITQVSLPSDLSFSML